jgi:hypothetical protein
MANLFEDFSPVSSKQNTVWTQGRRLQWNLDLEFPEDIKVKPFYHKDEFTSFSLPHKSFGMQDLSKYFCLRYR